MHACIDLGSNSFHLLIGEWNNGRIKILERLSEKVQLGEDVRTSGAISPAAFERGIDCLVRFRELMDKYPLERYWALGTNTFRVTANAEEFIAAAADVGIEISIISGVQEAVLIYAGVITSLSVSDARRLVIDVGGGSTEVIIGQGHDRHLTESLPIGSVAWRDRFFADQSVTTEKLVAQMEIGREAARKVFAVKAAAAQKIGWSKVYASSGTVKMLSYICEEHGYGKGKIRLDGLLALQVDMARCIAEESCLPGMKESRRDLLLAGWCVLVGFMEVYGIDRIHFSATALREGMLDFMAKNSKTMEAMSRSNLPDVILTDS